jgi:large subunit ribosomal protein L2
VKLKSGELRKLHSDCIASVGIASNTSHFLRKLKKAGDTRHLGLRPRSRPSAMNPVDLLWEVELKADVNLKVVTDW